MARGAAGLGGTPGQGYPFATWALVVGLTVNPVEHEARSPTAGELACLLAHDLRTPLNAIRGFAELMLGGAAGPLSGEAIELLVEIARAGRALEEAVLCAQELGEPCMTAGEGTLCGMRALLAETGFVIGRCDMPGAAEVAGEPAGWRRLLGACRDHLREATGAGSLSAELRFVGEGPVELVLGADGHAGRPASALRERFVRGLAATQGAVLASEPPHRPVRLVLPREVTG